MPNLTPKKICSAVQQRTDDMVLLEIPRMAQNVILSSLLESLESSSGYCSTRPGVVVGPFGQANPACPAWPWALESVQDVLIKLDIKPCMHLVEINIFSLNHVIVRLTKTMNTTSSNISKFVSSESFFCVKNWSNLSEKKIYKEYFTRRPPFVKKCF